MPAETDVPRRRRDPKSIVTPDAFSVSPELLGAPLAAPRRRFAAITLDLLLVALLDALNWRLLLGGAMVALFLLLVRRPAAGRALRAVRGCAAVLLAAATVFATFLPTLVRQGNVLPEDFQMLSDSLNQATQDSAVAEGDLGRGEPPAATGPGLAAADSPVADPGVAGADMPTVRLGLDSPTVGLGPAAPDAQTVPAAPEPPSTAVAWIRDVADEAGLIFGWGTVYLTLFTALWHGRTPGKRLMDLRVVCLTGEPLGLMRSFERAGGYAAGFATGLLGFARVWWDPNRQAIHDKIAETVVIRERLSRDRRDRGRPSPKPAIRQDAAPPSSDRQEAPPPPDSRDAAPAPDSLAPPSGPDSQEAPPASDPQEASSGPDSQEEAPPPGRESQAPPSGPDSQEAPPASDPHGAEAPEGHSGLPRPSPGPA